jgi:hypothetical protein
MSVNKRTAPKISNCEYLIKFYTIIKQLRNRDQDIKKKTAFAVECNTSNTESETHPMSQNHNAKYRLTHLKQYTQRYRTQLGTCKSQ